MHKLNPQESVGTAAERESNDGPTSSAEAPGDSFPLAPLQRGMIVGCLDENRDDAYTFQQVFTARTSSGPMSPALIAEALEGLAMLHPVLRTAILLDDPAAPRQVVMPDRRIEFTEHDLRASETNLDAWLEADLARGFDLATDSLMRVSALRVGEQLDLVWTYHHAILDVWCLETLFSDFLELHDALSDGEALEAAVARLSVGRAEAPFRAYVEGLQNYDHDGLVAYWRDLFADYEGTPDLVATERPDGQPGQVGSVMCRVGHPLADAVRSLAATHDATVGGVLQAAWVLVLMRATRTDDLAIGTVVSDLDERTGAKAVGLYINVVPSRITVTPTLTVAGLIRQVRDQHAASAPHRHASLGQIQGISGHSEGLVRALFAHETKDWQAALTSERGTSLSLCHDHRRTSFPLNLIGRTTADGIVLELIRDRGVYAQAEAQRLLGRVLRVLEQFVADPSSPVTEVATLTPEEERLVLEDFNANAQTFSGGGTAAELFLAEAEAHPERAALVWEDGSLTYGDLRAQALSVAARLHRAGIPRRSAVGVMGERGPALIIGMMAALLSGNHFVPFDVGHPRERIEHMAVDCGLRAMLTAGWEAAQIAAHPGTLPAGCVSLSLDDDACTGAAPELHEATLPKPDDLAYVIYTSGTTGQPKGVALHHRGLVNLRHVLLQIYGVTATDRVLQFAAPTFDASVWELTLSLLCGVGLVVVDQDTIHDVERLEQLAERLGVTLAALPPQYFLTTGNLRLRVLTTAGSASSANVVNKALRTCERYINAYGPTENTVQISVWEAPGTPMDPAERIPIGWPTANSQVYVLNGSRVCGVGEPGELCVAGACVARGYLNRPELNAEKFVPNPFGEGMMYRTGDVARWLPDGSLDFCGRLDNQVKVRGFRVELGEVESALRQLDGVRDVVVTTCTDHVGELEMVGYVVGESHLNPTAMRDQLAELLPRYMIPAHVVQMDEIPLTRHGKPDLRALPAVTVPSDPAAGEPTESSGVEHQVCVALAEVLGLDAVSPGANFFELGGDSIKAIRLVSKMRSAGYDLNVGTVLGGGTPRRIARGTRLRAENPHEQGEVTGEVRGMPIAEEFFAKALAEPSHFNQDIVLEVGQTTADVIRQSLDAVWSHHDALRSVVCGDALVIRDVAGAEPYGFETHRVSEDAERRPALLAIAERLQRSIDLASGPLVKAALVQSPRGGSLFICIHHLVVDGVSWRVLAEDILTCIWQAQQGREIALPEKTASLVEWAHALKQARVRIDARESGYWDVVESRADGAQLQVAAGAGSGVARIEFSLDRTLSTLLLRGGGRAYHAEPLDLLLGAFASAVAARTGQEEVAVRLETHGRTGLDGMPLVDRTVGWFTAEYPLVLPCCGEPREAIVASKESLRGVPRKGFGYGLRPKGFSGIEAIVTFNYLGEVAEAGQDDDFGAVRMNETGLRCALENRFAPGLRVLVTVRSHLVHVEFDFDTEVIDEVQAAALAEAYENALTEIAAHCRDCLELGLTVRTPSDFSASGLTADEVERIVGQLSQSGQILDVDGIEDIHDLSPLQEAILLEAQQNPCSGAYVLQQVVDAHMPAGDVDVCHVRDALRAVMARHSALRTAIVSAGLPRPRQVVLAERTCHVEEAHPSEALGALDALLESDADRGFDLATDPLVRVTVLPRETGVTMLWTFHHIVIDAWCMGAIFEDFVTAYENLAAGQPPAEVLDAARRAAPDLASVLTHLQQRGDDGVEDYWCELLSGYEGNSGILPVEPADGQGTGRQRLALGWGLTDRLSRLAISHAMTLSGLVEAAWGLILMRATGSQDVVFGKVVSGRDVAAEGADTVVGLLANTVPVRVRCTPTTTVGELLTELRDQALASSRFDRTSLARIQRATKQPHLVQTLYAQQVQVAQVCSAGGALTLDIGQSREKTGYPLNLLTSTSDDGLVLELLYDADVHAAAEITRLLTRMSLLLEQFTAEPRALVTSLSTLTDGEGERILGNFNATAREYPRDSSLPERFEQILADDPRRTALVCGVERISYAELNDLADRVARALWGADVGIGDRVAILADPGRELFAGLLGVVKAGASYVPLEIDAPAARTGFILADCKASVVLAFGQRADELLASPGCRPEDCHVINLAAVLDVPPIECEPPEQELDGDSELYVLYTSGTTGQPKGTIIQHRSVMRLVVNSLAQPMEPGDVMLQAGSLAFDASTLEIWGMWLNGGTVVVPTSRSQILAPSSLAALICGERVNKMFLTTSLFNQLVDMAPECLEGLTWLSTGGERISPEHVARLYRVNDEVVVVNGYGPTENTTFSATYVVPRDFTTIPIGTPITNSQIYVMDGDRLCGIGEIGELCMGGDGVALGYLNRPDLTAERFVPNPFGPGRMYRSGDLGRWRPDGTVEFLGRRDDQVKVRGFRVELGEIETALERLPYIRNAVVLAQAEANLTLSLSAYLVADVPLEMTVVRQELAAIVPHYMVPSHFLQLEALPLNRNGKVDRKAMPCIEVAARTDSAAPATPIEQTLCEAFAEVLGLEQVGVDDDFFELGGDSIRAMRLVNNLRRQQVHVTVTDVLRSNTPGCLAILAEAHAEGATPDVTDEPAAAAMTPAAARVYLAQFQDPDSLAYNVPFGLEVAGRLDPERLEKALRGLVARHSALRTSFRAEPTGLVQEVTHASIDLEITSGDGCDFETLVSDFTRPFDLATPPLLRARLIQGTAADLLLLDVHHIAFDGWSLKILLADLGSAYAGQELPPAPGYEAYRRYLDGVDLEAQRLYWSEMYARCPQPLDIPTDAAAPADLDELSTIRTLLAPHIAQGLTTLARSRQATLFHTYLTAVSILLQKFTMSDDIIIGVPSDGRRSAELEEVVGMCVNTLAMRTNPSDDVVVGDLLEDVRDRAIAAYAHQDYPYDAVVSDLVGRGLPPGQPLVQVLLAFNQAPSVPDFDGQDAMLRVPQGRGAKFDLEFTVTTGPAGHEIGIEYRSAVLADETAELLLTYLKAILTHLPAQVDSLVADIDLEPGQPLELGTCADALPTSIS